MKKILFILIFLILILLPLVAFADLDIHFLDVGDADAMIVVCDGEAMVIDAGEAISLSMKHIGACRGVKRAQRQQSCSVS